jgi:wyosine [tRNA(Phe)-imidazoG37] synthetase (radical SAM superfamily)
MHQDRRKFYPPEMIIEDVRVKIEKVRAAGDTIDYLTLVPDGEPTLDVNLGRIIEGLRRFGIQVAVITNSTMLWREDVKKDLMKADWVSVKVDSVYEGTWRKINRPHYALSLPAILEGILEFSGLYNGELATETMLVKDLNDGEKSIEAIARFLSDVNPARAYLSVPTRPPAVDEVQPPDEDTINRCFQIFKESIDQVEYLIGYEGNAYSCTGDAEADILSITAVHPMREDAVRELLARSDSDAGIVEKLLTEDKLVETDYMGKRYYLRRFNRNPGLKSCTGNS